MTSTVILSDNGVSSGSAGLKETGGNDGVLILQTTTSGGTATNAVYVDTSQNVGMGAAPLGWSGSKSLTLLTPSGSVYTSLFTVGNTVGLTSNAYYDGTNWKYGINYTTQQYYMGDGAHVWRTATASTGTISWTEVMRTDASSNFLVGATSVLSGTTGVNFVSSNTNGILAVQNTNASFGATLFYGLTSRAANSGFDFAGMYANGVGQFRVNGAGTIYAQNIVVQSISDQRLKENIRDATDGLDVINALRTVRYDWKEGYGNDRKDQLGFIAQEVEAVFPEAVDEWQVNKEDETVYKTVGPAAFIPVLVKAMQEQQALITTLTERITALEAK